MGRFLVGGFPTWERPAGAFVIDLDQIDRGGYVPYARRVGLTERKAIGQSKSSVPE
jgi:hypothetical protein